MVKKFIDVRSKKTDIDLMTLDDAIEHLTRIREEIGFLGGRSLVRFNTDYEGDVSFYVCYKREETDDEYADRVKREKQIAEGIRQRDLKLLAELKAKYEKEV